MRSLRDGASGAGQNGAGQNGAGGIDAETVRALFALSPEERRRLLFARAAQARADGTLTDADLAAMAERVRPLLTPEQYERLLELVGQL